MPLSLQGSDFGISATTGTPRGYVLSTAARDELRLLLGGFERLPPSSAGGAIVNAARRAWLRLAGPLRYTKDSAEVRLLRQDA